MQETAPLVKAAIILRRGAWFDAYIGQATVIDFSISDFLDHDK
jgi:hypothetical protein